MAGHTELVIDDMMKPVRLVMPATGENVFLARSLAAAIATRADLPVDQLEDLRLAVSEAVTGAVTDALPGTEVECVFAEEADWIEVHVNYAPVPGRSPDTDGFGWAIMRALATELSVELAGDRVTIAMRVERTLPVEA